MSETRKRAKYTLEFKMEAVRLVKGGQAVSVTAIVLYHFAFNDLDIMMMPTALGAGHEESDPL